MDSGPKPQEDYDDLFSGTTPVTDLTKEQAFAILLAAAVRVDLTVQLVEIEEMLALADRTRTLSKLTEEERRKHCDMAMKSVADPNQIWDAVGNACDKLYQLDTRPNELNNPNAPDITVSVFAHACDIIFADQNVVDVEKKLLQFMAARMKINPDAAKQIVNLMQKKNMY